MPRRRTGRHPGRRPGAAPRARRPRSPAARGRDARPRVRRARARRRPRARRSRAPRGQAPGASRWRGRRWSRCCTGRGGALRARAPSRRSAGGCQYAAVGLPPAALARRCGRRPEDVAVAAECRGLDPVDVLNVVHPVGGELIEGDRARRRFGGELLLVEVDEAAHLHDRRLLVKVAVGHAAAAPPPAAAGVTLDPRRADPTLDLAPARVSPLGLVEDAVALLADHERAVERCRHAVPPPSGRFGYHFGYQTGWDEPDMVPKNPTRFG